MSYWRYSLLNFGHPFLMKRLRTSEIPDVIFILNIRVRKATTKKIQERTTLPLSDGFTSGLFWAIMIGSLKACCQFIFPPWLKFGYWYYCCWLFCWADASYWKSGSKSLSTFCLYHLRFRFSSIFSGGMEDSLTFRYSCHSLLSLQLNSWYAFHFYC